MAPKSKKHAGDHVTALASSLAKMNIETKTAHYLDQFADEHFTPNHAAPIESEIGRLGDLRNWGDDLRHKHYEKAHQAALGHQKANKGGETDTASYFNQFADEKFKPDHKASISSEVKRLGDLRGWGESLRKKHHEKADQALSAHHANEKASETTASQYFDQFADETFKPDHTATIASEVKRLGDIRGWGDKRRRQHLEKASQADLIKQTNGKVGTTNKVDKTDSSPYFDQFADKTFTPDHTASIASEIQRLGDLRGWGEKLRRKHSKRARQANLRRHTRSKPSKTKQNGKKNKAGKKDQTGKKIQPSRADQTGETGKAGKPSQTNVPASSVTLDSPRFFDQFVDDDFEPDYTAGILSEINRIGDLRRWGKGLRRKHFREALGAEWTHFMGDSDKLLAFQTLCRDLGVEVGLSITKCKKNLEKTFISIVDYLDSKRAREEIGPVFQDRKRFFLYLDSHGWVKIYPLRMAKGDIILKAMLKRLEGHGQPSR